MFNRKKNNIFFAIVLITATFNAHSMMERRSSEDTREQQATISGEGPFELVFHDINLVKDILLGRIKISSKQMLAAFMYLPIDQAKKIVRLLSDIDHAESIIIVGKKINELAGRKINRLSGVNGALNKLINDPVFCLQLIKYLAHKFNRSDEVVAMALQTEETNNRLFVQKMFERNFTQYPFNQMNIDTLYTSYETFVDLNFTYKGPIMNIDFAQNLLLAAAFHDATVESRLNKIKWLLNHSVNINSTDAFMRTVLMICAVDIDINSVKFLCEQPAININQQDNHGDTALMVVCIQPIFPPNYNQIIQILLDAGADPEIANHMGMTPIKEAQKDGRTEAVRLMQEAINKKRSQK
ncbi:MAG TPA: ankyrin repeat domain-containing protein [Candidatus Babeliales bacterium]|jgi:hypothetical protein|nr:ankyrin repeat domain-containing protein [Candidatus Babeliales bacterium]